MVGFELQQLANLSRCSSSAIGNEVFGTFAMARFFGGENKKPGSQRGSGRDTPHCISDHNKRELFKKRLRKMDVDGRKRKPRQRMSSGRTSPHYIRQATPAEASVRIHGRY
jgi:hypothetical protein